MARDRQRASVGRRWGHFYRAGWAGVLLLGAVGCAEWGVTPAGVGDWSATEDAACRKAAAEDPFPTAAEAGIPPAQPVD